MFNKAKWIWYYGDYEIFHSLLLHGRREEFGASYPPMWTMSGVYPLVYFSKTYEIRYSVPQSTAEADTF